jgi:endonuclease YncB( thermonuclease family)
MPESALLFCLVIAIADGDTLTARCDTPAGKENITIRLAEIDAPEKRQPFGTRSRQHLAELCFKKTAEVKHRARDRYGRTVGRVTCEGVDANVEQVRAGMAWAYKQYVTDPHIPDLERDAKRSGIGLWSDANPIAPWQWRRSQAHGSCDGPPPWSAACHTRPVDGD